MNARKIIEKASQKLDIPTDITANLPCIRIRGFGECTLDCHKGIIAYEENEIVIRLNIGTVTIQGSGLQIKQMHRDCLTVCGTICAMQFSGGKC